MLSVALPQEMEKRIADLASKAGCSPDEVVQEALALHLEDLEDAQSALERLKNPDRRWTLEDVENGLDLEG